MQFEYKEPAFGFESTWRFDKSLKHIQEYVDNDMYFLADPTEPYKFLIESPKFKKTKEKLNLFDDIYLDDGNIEIPTKVVTSKEKLLKQFGKLITLMKEHNMVPSSASHNNNFEGGGHIHIGYDKIINIHGNNIPEYDDVIKKKNEFISLLFENLTTFTINYPTVAWALNAPEDNINAMSCLQNKTLKRGINMVKATKKSFSYAIGTGISSKCYAISLRYDLKTFEFRFFTMPKTVEQLEFQIDLAQKIFKYCFDLTNKGIALEAKYTKPSEYVGFTVEEAVANVKESAKLLSIKYANLVKFGRIKSLKDRFKLEAIHNAKKTIINTYLK